MLKIKDWNYITDKNKIDDYLIYDNKSTSNVLFIGSCRITAYMFFFDNLPVYLSNKPNIYGINCMLEKLDISKFKAIINSILTKTTHIISEFISNYGILNSDSSKETTFCKTFVLPVEAKYSVFPNLECRYYTSQLIKTFAVKPNNTDLYDYYVESRQKLRDLINALDYNEINTFIDKNFTEKRLFYVHNHPTAELMLEVFCLFLRNNKINYDVNYTNNMKTITIFNTNISPVFQRDVELYGFKWCNSVYNDSDFYSTHEIV